MSFSIDSKRAGSESMHILSLPTLPCWSHKDLPEPKSSLWSMKSEKLKESKLSLLCTAARICGESSEPSWLVIFVCSEQEGSGRLVRQVRVRHNAVGMELENRHRVFSFGCRDRSGTRASRIDVVSVLK